MKTYLVFDVESAGFNGPAFAFGYVVVTEDRKEIEAGWVSCGLDDPMVKPFCKPDDEKWLRENLPAEVLSRRNNMLREEMVDLFAFLMRRAKEEGWIVVTDCGHPVETRFLLECGEAPYPLLDVSTALAIRGFDPVGAYDRRENELPKHHPLADARQSARLWLECVSGRNEFLNEGGNTYGV